MEEIEERPAEPESIDEAAVGGFADLWGLCRPRWSEILAAQWTAELALPDIGGIRAWYAAEEHGSNEEVSRERFRAALCEGRWEPLLSQVRRRAEWFADHDVSVRSCHSAVRAFTEPIALLVLDQYRDQPARMATVFRAFMDLGCRLQAAVGQGYTDSRTRLLRGVLDSIGDPVIACDRKGRLTTVNAAAAPFVTGRLDHDEGPPALVGLTALHTGAPIPHAQLPLSRALRGEVVEGLEVVLRPPGTSDDILVSATARPLWDDQGAVRGGVLAFRDITRARRDEQALRDSSAELHRLSRRLLKAQEDERRAVARELHDAIGQVLTGLHLTLEMHVRAHPDQKLAEARAMVHEAITKVRDLSLMLRPTILDDLGLLAALPWKFERYTRRTGIQVAYERRCLEQRFPAEVEVAVFRIVQEALTNVARHAEVPSLAVHVHADAEQLSVTVRDWGRGFDPGRAASGFASSGLAGMRERAELLGGALTILSRPGNGTLVRVDLPLAGPPEDPSPVTDDAPPTTADHAGDPP